MGDTRNLIIFLVFAAAILIPYQLFVLGPQSERQREAQQAAIEDEQAGTSSEAPVLSTDIQAGPGQSLQLSRPEALEGAERIEIQTPSLDGSISLIGARFDDLRLLRYNTEVDSNEPVTLLNPEGGPEAHYVISGWTGVEGAPGPDAVWSRTDSGALTPSNPVTLEYRSDNLVFQRTLSVDEDYLFTVSDTVTNQGAQAVTLARYGLVRYHGLPTYLDRNAFILQEGPQGVAGSAYFDAKYKNMDAGDLTEQEGEGGWVGLGSKYWLAAISPEGTPNIQAEIRTRGTEDNLRFEANYIRDAQSLAPGETLTSDAFIYTGSKDAQLLSSYEEQVGIPRFDMAIDWGMFWFLTRPFFFIIHWFYGVLGNYGLGIMALVVILKLLLFPLNNKAFASMAKMRTVAPKMQEIRERFESDKQRQQQEIMELYKREKINPLAGCLPILPQIPIFFALYKTVFISLDARHAPFFGWVKDMSAADPTNVWNLFGILPYDPSGWAIVGNGAMLGIGLWPILMGLTMWGQQSLNPPPPDPMQRRIFAFLPIVFTFVLAPFAAALVIYWTWNNFLTILQQYIIMRRHGTVTEVDKRIAWLRGRITGNPVEIEESPNTGTTPQEKISAVVDEAAEASPDPDLSDVSDEPETPSKRTRSNPAAKKKRPRKKKPGGKS